MKRKVLIVLICILVGIPLCVAIEGKSVSLPTMDVNIYVTEDDVSYMALDFIVTNPSQKEVALTGLRCYINDGERFEERWSAPKLLNPLETVTITRSSFIPQVMPLKRFLREGFITYSINGSLLAKIDNESFEVPFENATTVYLEVDEKEAKQVIGPNITDIELKTSRLVSPSGEITDVFINLSIIITNSNPTIICWDILDYDVYFKKDDKWMLLSSEGAAGGTIKSMGTYRKSMVLRESDDKVIQYLLSGNPTEIKIRGSMFMHPKERGWNPTYFGHSFEHVITTINGSGVWGEPLQTLTPTPTPTPTSTAASPTETPKEQGFEAIFTIIGLLAIAYFLKRRK